MQHNFRIAELSEEWDAEFLASYGIAGIGSVFVFDLDEVTHIASTQPSYFGYFLYYNIYMLNGDDVDISDEIWDAIHEEPGEDDYFPNIPAGVDVVENREDDETYEELIEFVTEHYRSNQLV